MSNDRSRTPCKVHDDEVIDHPRTLGRTVLDEVSRVHGHDSHAALRVIAVAGIISGTAFGQQPPAKDTVVLLDQGWSKQDRLKYYFTTQGSAVLPYEIFLNLEEAGSEELFRSDRNSAAFGLISQPADATYNPDGLPIGVTKTTVPEGRWKGDWVGLTCATCHNNELNYRGSKIRIDGGNNNRIVFTGYIAALDEALAATAAGPEKFDRLARTAQAGGCRREGGPSEANWKRPRARSINIASRARRPRSRPAPAAWTPSPRSTIG